MPKDFKFKTSFSSIITAGISKDYNKYLSEASIKKLKDLIPNVNIDKNIDLLSFVGNACVVNLINLNDDGITTATALANYKSFINKYVNVEHERDKVIGVILTVGFSEFGTDKILTEEEVKDYTKPFNITVGGIIWRTVNEELAEFIESSSDPTSENYLKASISWEIGFEEEEFILIKGKSRNTEDGKILTDEKEISAARKALRSYGGTGTYEGYHVYRLIKGDALPLGIGLTQSPAANVRGILSQSNASTEHPLGEISKDTIEFIKSLNDENKRKELLEIAAKEKISAESVNNNKDNTENKLISVNKTMKLNSIKELTDEKMKEVSASAVIETFETALKEAGQKWSDEKTAQEKAVKELEERNKTIIAEADKAKKELEGLSAELNKLKAEAEARRKEETFNTRMAKLDETYELTAEDRAELVEDVKNLDDTAYAKFEKKMSVFLKAKKKEAKASTTDSIEDVIDDAIDGGKKDKTSVAATTSPEVKGMDKYKNAFELGKGIKLVK